MIRISTYAAAASFLIGSAIAGPAEAQIRLNGTTLNGTSLQGTSMNGTTMNGLTMNGTTINGLTMNGLLYNGSDKNGVADKDRETRGFDFNGVTTRSVILNVPQRPEAK